MARRRRRVMLAIGALVAAAAHSAALSEPSGRRLITFDEAHTALSDTVSEVADEAADATNDLISALTSSVLGGTELSDETTSGSPSATIITSGGTSTSDAKDETAEKFTIPASENDVHEILSDEDSSSTHTFIADSVTTTAASAPTTMWRSGVSHAVSISKRPPPTALTSTHLRYASTSDETREESIADSGTESAAPTAAPAPREDPPTIPLGTQPPPSVSMATEAPAVATVPVPVPVMTEIPVTLVATTAPATQAPAEVTPTTTQSSSVAGTAPESGVIDDATDAPPITTAGSTSIDATVIIPDESTAVPIATTRAPVTESGSVDTSAGTPSVGAMASPDWSATWPGSSSGSNNNNETVTVVSESGSEEVSPGQVHASSSADVSSDGSSFVSDPDSSESSKSKDDYKRKSQRKKEPNSSSGDGSSGMGALFNPGGVSDVNTSSATYYSLGTGPIVAIVGVIAGIVGLLVLFVAISRKKYTDDDGESSLPYGYNMDIHSVARLSPTFLQDDSFMESGYNGTPLMVAVPPPTYTGAASISGESSDEVPSLHGSMMVANKCDPVADISLRSRVPSVQSFGGDWDTGNVRMSALYSAGSSVTSGSAISGSWSSVLASDTERQPSRNTRDSSLSAWSVANLSSFGSTASSASGMYRMTRSSSAFSALSAEMRLTGGSVRSRSSSRLTNQSDTNRVAAEAVESNRSNKSTEI